MGEATAPLSIALVTSAAAVLETTLAASMGLLYHLILSIYIVELLLILLLRHCCDELIKLGTGRGLLVGEHGDPLARDARRASRRAALLVL